MSGLRRSRPDEQDESLRRFHDIKISHTSQLTGIEKPARPSSYSFESNSFTRELKNTAIPLNNENYPLRNSSYELETSLTKGNVKGNLIVADHLVERPVMTDSSVNKQLCCEPNEDHILQINDSQEEISYSGKKWQKLRSLLVAMKDDAFDVDKYLESSFVKYTEIDDAKFSSQENMQTLLSENAQLKESLQTLECELLQMKSERDSALTYIYQLKSKASLTRSETTNILGINQQHEQGMEVLKSPDITKEQVLEIMVPVVNEFKHQKSYLDRLMMVVVMRAPWMMDELDEDEMVLRSDTEEDDTNSDDEVWC